MKVCTTTNRQVSSGFVEFKCPSCLKGHIVRSDWARTNSKVYACPACGFEGP